MAVLTFNMISVSALDFGKSFTKSRALKWSMEYVIKFMCSHGYT